MVCRHSDYTIVYLIFFFFFRDVAGLALCPDWYAEVVELGVSLLFFLSYCAVITGPGTEHGIDHNQI